MTRALLEQARDALTHIETCIHGHDELRLETIYAIRAHLAQPQGEPVAWINPAGTYAEASTSSTVYGSHTIPLYIHPAHTEADIDAAQQAQPGHKPMTDGEKLYAMWHSSDANDLDDFLDGWRHAEAFHGIKEKP